MARPARNPRTSPCAPSESPGDGRSRTVHDLRFGLVGASRGLRLAEVCRDLSHVQVVAVYDVDRDRSVSAATTLGAMAFHAFDAFLDSGVDAVVIASPIPAHTAQVQATLAAGKHVLCEVLPCATIVEAQSLVRAVRASR